jgi:hypothetical protein
MEFVLSPKTPSPHLRLEAAWTLTNLVTGTPAQTASVVEKGAIPLFIGLLSSKLLALCEQAVWALGNIAGEDVTFRDKIIDYGGIENILRLLDRAKSRKLMKQAVWVLSNLCRKTPIPEFEKIRLTVPFFTKILAEETSSELLTDSLWALVYISGKGNPTSADVSTLDVEKESQIDEVANPLLIERLMRLLRHQNSVIVAPTLRVIGNMICISSRLTDTYIDLGLINELKMLIESPQPSVLKETSWVLSNITAGTASQVDKVISDDVLLSRIFDLLGEKRSPVHCDNAAC